MSAMNVWSKRAAQVIVLILAAVLPSIAAAIDLTPKGTFQREIGIDYSEREGNPIVTYDFNAPGGSKVGVWDRVTGQIVKGIPIALSEENKVATVRQVVKNQQGNNACDQQWPVGTIFTGTGVPGQIAKLEPQPDGTYIVTPAWVTILNETIFRGGFFHDRFCVAGGDLIVVSGNGVQPTTPTSGGGNVYRIHEDLISHLVTVTFLKHINRPALPGDTGPAPAHLEGVIVVPNEPATYGPFWAGKIVTGDEDRSFLSNGTAVNGPNPKIYAIDVSNGPGGLGTAGCSQSDNGILSLSCTPTFHVQTNVAPGQVAPPGGLPHPEDFDFIEGDFYGVAFNDSDVSTPKDQGHVFFAPFADFTAGGNILITQEYPVAQIFNNIQVDVGANSGLYQVRWDGAQFVATELVRTTAGVCGTTPNDRCLSQWEHVGFVPTSDVTIVKSPDGNSFNIGDNINFTMVLTSTGPGTASNVVLTDPLPTPGSLTTWAVDSVSSTGLITPAASAASCSINVSQQLTCNVGAMAAGATFTVKVKTTTAGGANLAACTANGGRVDNTAKVTADPSISKTDPGYYTCTPPGSYTLTKNPKNATYNIGDNINFTMVVTSTGPGTAKNVVLNDPLPTLGNLSSWVFASGGNPGSVCTIVSNTLNCPFGDLANGQSRTVVVTTNAAGGANAAACPGGSKLNNTATLTGTGLPTKTDTGDYTCTPKPKITLKKTPDGGTFVTGDQLIFTMVVTNNGSVTAPNVTLSDPLLNTNGLTWTVVSVTSTGTITPAAPTTASCSINASQVLTCSNLGNLAAGATVTVVVKTTNVGGVPAALCNGNKINNIATASATGIQPVTDSGDYTCACVNKPDGDKDKDGSKDKDTDVSSDKDKDKDKDVSSDKDKDKDTQYAALSLSQDKDKDKDTGVNSDKDKDKDTNKNNSCPANNNDKDKDKNTANTDKDKDTDKNSKKS